MDEEIASRVLFCLYVGMSDLLVETHLIRMVDDGAGIGGYFFFFQAEDGIRDYKVTGVQTCALPISLQRTMSGGISLATLQAKSAGCRAHAETARRTVSTASARASAESRKQRSSFQGIDRKSVV